MPASVKKNGGGHTHLVHSKEPVTTGIAPAPTLMPVAEYVVHPGLHAEEDLAHNPEVVHVVAFVPEKYLRSDARR
jgi:hypothetical protein